MKTTILLLSGGLDSTACFFKLLEETTDKIIALYVDLSPANAGKAWCERQVVKYLESIYDDNYHIDLQICDKRVKFVNTEISVYGRPKDGFSQPPLWIQAAAFAAGEHEADQICVGYNRGDEARDYINDIIDLLRAHWELMSFEDTHTPTLYTPFINTHKGHIISYLKKIEKKLNKPILNKLWVCESPDFIHTVEMTGYKRCMKCTPCKRLNRCKSFNTIGP